MVKGWATERAATHLDAVDDLEYCLSAAGDMVCRTRNPASPPWRVGVEHPLDPSRLVAVVPIRNGASATSGTAHRGAHIVHARTGRTLTSVGSDTVVARSLTEADIHATAAFALGGDAVRWLRGKGCSGVVVWRDGTAEIV